MPDTIKTRADLQTLYADNTTREISPQDLRDGLVSWMGVYGGLVGNGNSQGPTAGAILNVWDTVLPQRGVTGSLVTETLTIGAGAGGDYFVSLEAGVSYSGGGANPELTLELFVNGAPHSTPIRASIDMAQNLLYQAGFVGILPLVEGDALSVKLTATQSKTWTFASAQIVARRLA